MDRDIAFAVRSFRKSPGFTATIVFTLALTIGASTAMFSIVNGVLLNPLPLANSDRLVWTANRGTRPYDAMSPPDYHDWSQGVTSFEATATWVKSRAALDGAATPEQLPIADVTDNWFSMLGVRLQHGRGFAKGEEGIGKPKVVVLSDGLWRSQFGADASIVGRSILLDGTRYDVIGIAPPRFDLPDRVALWRPMAIQPSGTTCRGCRFFYGPIALLKPGVSFEHARTEARIVAARMHAQYPQSEDGLSFDIQPLKDHFIGSTRIPLLVLLGAVACLLLIACANVATLLVVRTGARSSELALRMAIGAGRMKIVVQVLVESLILALAGGVLGIVLAEGAVRAIGVARPDGLPPLVDISIDPRVAIVAFLTMTIAAMVFGMGPAIQAGRTDVMHSLKSGSGGSTGRRGAASSHGVFLATQIAFVVPILIAASLLTQSFSRLVAQDVGFRADGVVQFDLSLPVCGTIWAPDTTCAHSVGASYKSGVQVQRFTHELLGALRSMPGTVSAAAGFGVPFSATSKQQDDIVIKGLPAPPKERPNVVEHKYVTPGYFATLGIPLIKGRDFNDTDVLVTDTLTPRTVIVSEGAVKAYFGGADPIGKVLVEQGTVIGVVGDTKTQALSGDPEPAVYNSLDQQPIGWFTVLIRSTSDAGSVISGARTRVAAIDRTLPLDHIGELKTAVDASASSTRLAATVLGGFAFAALLLAVLGVYGLVSYSVRARRRELGIRLALGAPRGGLVSLMVRGGLVFVSAGVIVGLVLSVVAGGVVRGLVFGVSVNDPMTYAAAVGTLFAIAAVASWIPARRASQVDPLITMRSD